MIPQKYIILYHSICFDVSYWKSQKKNKINDSPQSYGQKNVSKSEIWNFLIFGRNFMANRWILAFFSQKDSS